MLRRDEFRKQAFEFPPVVWLCNLQVQILMESFDLHIFAGSFLN